MYMAISQVPGVAAANSTVDNFHGLKQVGLPLMFQESKGWAFSDWCLYRSIIENTFLHRASNFHDAGESIRGQGSAGVCQEAAGQGAAVIMGRLASFSIESNSFLADKVGKKGKFLVTHHKLSSFGMALLIAWESQSVILDLEKNTHA